MLKIVLEILSSIVMLLTIYEFAIKPAYQHIMGETKKLKYEKDFEKLRESKEEYQKDVLSGKIKTDILVFDCDNKKFISKTKKQRKIIVSISTILLILGILGILYGFKERQSAILQNGILCFFCSIVGFIYYAARYYDKSDDIAKYSLYYDVNKDIIFLDASGAEISFNSLKEVSKVIYLIKSVSYILVNKDEITLIGDVIRVTFNKAPVDNSYVDYIQLNKEIEFSSDSIKIKMFAQEVKSIKILRGYFGFEEFLISKNYIGSENLH